MWSLKQTLNYTVNICLLMHVNLCNHVNYSNNKVSLFNEHLLFKLILMQGSTV